MPIYTDFTINNRILRVSFEPPDSLSNGKIQNIEVLATQAERYDLLRKLYDSHANPKNSTYTYIFQNYLAKYKAESIRELNKLQNNNKEADIKQLKTMQNLMDQLHRMSAQFVVFEVLLNYPTADEPGKILQNLLDLIDQHYLPGIEAITKTYDAKNNLINQLQPNIQDFRQQLETMIAQGATRHDVDKLFSIQTRDSNIKSLGSFMATQMTDILEHGIKTAYEISDNRFKDLLTVPDAIAALSDAKASIQLKAFSLDGAEYNETYAPIPENMLRALTPETRPKSSNNSPNISAWFSLMPYLHHFNPEDLDKMFCLVTERDFYLDNAPNSMIETLKDVSIVFLKLLASAIELMVYVPFRFFATLVFSMIDLTGSIIHQIMTSALNLLDYVTGLDVSSTWENSRILNPQSSSKWTRQLEQQLSDLHANISMVKASKRLSNRRYQRTDDKNHQNLLEACMDDSNFFHEVFIYFNSEQIANFIKDFFTSIVRAVDSFFKNPLYLFSGRQYQAKPEEVYAFITLRHQMIKQYQTKLESDVQASTKEKYEVIKHCPINQISSPLEVFREVMLTLDDSIIDPMFRKSPGAATFYFMVSMTTFGTYIAPAASIAWMKSVPTWLQIPTEVLSRHFTGKPASLGMSEQMVACFLEWKLGFFSTEFLIEMQRGNFDFFKEMVKEPEQVTLGLMGLIGMGMAIQYLPLLPTTIELPKIPGIPQLPPIYNYHAEVINLFIHEAQGCAEGTSGLTGVEYGFLGLKFSMLMHSMLTGAQAHEKQDVFKQLSEICTEHQFIANLIQACDKANLFDLDNQSEIDTIFQNLLDTALTTLLQEKNLDTQFLSDDISAFKSVLTQAISSDAIKEYRRLKKPTYRADAQNLLKGDTPELRFNHIIAEAADTSCDETPLSKAHRELHEAITLLSDKKNPLVLNQDPLKEANKLYDYLDSLFERYNHEAKQANQPSINKHAYLDVFYNRYCYKSSNNLLRSLLFVPVPMPFPPFYFPGVYVAAALFRGVKYGFAKQQNKPSVAHQVVKSFNKDLVLFMQIMAVIARTTQVMARAVAYTLRPLVALSLLALSTPFYLVYRGVGAVLGLTKENIFDRKSWFKTIDTWSSNMTSFHHLKLWELGPNDWAKPVPLWPWLWHTNDVKKIITWPLRMMRVSYAKAARIAGSSRDVSEAGKQMLEVLAAENKPATPTTPSGYDKINQSLEEKPPEVSDQPSPSPADIYVSKERITPTVSDKKHVFFGDANSPAPASEQNEQIEKNPPGRNTPSSSQEN